MKYIQTFENFINEGDLFKTSTSPAQAAADNIRATLNKIQDLQSKMSEKPEDAIYIKAQIDVEKEKIDVLKAQIRAESAKETLTRQKDVIKKQKEYEKLKAKK